MALCQNQTIVVVRYMEVQDFLSTFIICRGSIKYHFPKFFFQINAGMNKRRGVSCIRKFDVPTTGEKSSRWEKRLNILITNPY